MSRALELPDSVYRALCDAAARSGMTPAAWIAARVETPPAVERPEPARTLADLFAGRVGLVASGGKGRLSEDAGSAFADHLEEKRRSGLL